MKSINFKDKIEKEIVETIQTNEGAHDAINNVVKDRFVEKETFDQRFDRILEEMRIAREKSDERWERNDQRWENNDRKWEKSRKQWDENNRKWQESREQWKKNDERWEKNQKAITEILSSIKIVEINDEKLKDLFNSTVGALGARWGIRSEQSFRNALRGILEKNTDLKVLHVVEPDEGGIVFGRPEQIELDIVLRNGKFLIMEIKSSLSRADVILFVKKAEFYQERHNKKATALVMISPMIDDNARDYIAHFGIIAYSFATEVDPVILD